MAQEVSITDGAAQTNPGGAADSNGSTETCPPVMVYTKKVEAGLRSYIKSATCLRDQSDAYFDNPPDVRKRASFVSFS